MAMVERKKERSESEEGGREGKTTIGGRGPEKEGPKGITERGRDS
jgi:hypothetical protein